MPSPTLTSSRSRFESSRVQTKIPSRKGGTISRRTAALSKRGVAQPHSELTPPTIDEPEHSSPPVAGANAATEVVKQAEVLQSETEVSQDSEAEVEQIVVLPSRFVSWICADATDLDLRSLTKITWILGP